ncbi:MAG: hypothetical protein ACYC35_18855 [Pirellulales bacterium]
MPTIIAQQLTLAALGLAASLACAGCQPAAQPPAGTQSTHPAAQRKGGATTVPSTLGDDVMRARLLMTDLVQTDLGLTAEQVGKLKSYATTNLQQAREYRAKLREIIPSSQSSFPSDEFEAKKQEFLAVSEQMKNAGKQLRAKVFAVLTPAQTARLKEIELQATIPTALARPEIMRALDISQEQFAKIRVLLDQMTQKQAAESPDLGGRDPKDIRQKTIAFMKRSNEVRAGAAKPVLEVLTPEQRTKFDKMLGKKIEVTRLDDALIALMPEDAEYWSTW